jgi:anti-anti-sigma factor
MNVKIDTKEKFTVITAIDANITANMTDKIGELLLNYVNRPIPHVILNMKNVQTGDKEALEKIVSVQQQFYEKNCSFVVCELNENIKTILEQNDWLDTMNITPTESEAWDILQMEEIERELLGDPDGSE